LVFDTIYSLLINKYKLRTNIVATSGKDVNTYINYFNSILTKKSKGLFCELKTETFLKIKKQLEKRNDTNQMFVGHYNIFCYDDLTSSPYRIEDFGLGLKFSYVADWAGVRLTKQAAHFGLGKLGKAQILDGSRRYLSDYACVSSINNYLSRIGARLKSVNGINTDTMNKKEKVFKYGKKVAWFPGTKTEKGCTVQEHSVKIITTNRPAILHLFCYTNGGSMLTSLLYYK